MTSSKTSLSTDPVVQAFSDAASRYDELTSFHRQIAEELLSKIKENSISSAVDIGCGTGYLTGRIKQTFPDADIKGIDLALGMLKQAHLRRGDIQWLLANAHELPFEDKSQDLVVSNLAYQWSQDLLKAFSEARRVLSEKGILSASLFGYHTCEELFESILANTKIMEDLRRLPKAHQIKDALAQAGFKNIHLNRQQEKMQFADLWELLNWLKGIGANRLSQGQFLGPELLEKANAYCLKNYAYENGIRVSFEIIWISAHA